MKVVWELMNSNLSVKEQVERFREMTGMSRRTYFRIKARIEKALIYSPDYQFTVSVRGKGYIIDRVRYGRRVLEKALEYGAEFIQKPVLAPVVERGRVAGVKYDGGKERAQLVVDASGVAGVIKSKLPRNWPVAEPVREKMLAFRGILELEDKPERDVIKAYTDQKLAPKGYWWEFPEGDGVVNVGLGVRPEYRGQLFLNYRKILERYRVRKILEERGAYDPVQRPPLSLVGPGILVLGDAAPTVDPLTGGGMGSTFEAAFLAARNLERVSEEGWTYEALWSMNEYMREGGAKQARDDVLKLWLWKASEAEIKRALEIARNMNFFKLLTSPKLGKVALLAHRVEQHYRKYPENPEKLEGWARELEKLYNSF